MTSESCIYTTIRGFYVILSFVNIARAILMKKI